MIIIDCQGKPISEPTVSFAKSRLSNAKHVAMNPSQKDFFSDTVATFWDPFVPEGEFHFYDSESKLVAKIVNVQVPSARAEVSIESSSGDESS